MDSKDDNAKFDPDKTVPSLNESTMDRLRQFLKNNQTTPDLDDASNTKSILPHQTANATPHWGTAEFNNMKRLEITISEENITLTFSFDHLNEVLLGRHDAHSGKTPDIDLSSFEFDSSSISRRHAVIEHDKQTVIIRDLASTNGTFINGKQVEPNQPRILRNGDDLRLGDVLLKVNFSTSHVGS